MKSRDSHRSNGNSPTPVRVGAGPGISKRHAVPRLRGSASPESSEATDVGIVNPSAMLIGLLVLILAVTACGGSEVVVGGPANAAASAATLDGREFQSTAVSGNAAERELMDGTRIWLRFDDGEFAAEAACNTMNGKYRISQDQLLQITDFSSTEAGCDSHRLAQDAFVEKVLHAQPHLTLSGQDLVLTTDASTIKFSEHTPDPSVAPESDANTDDPSGLKNSTNE